MDCEGYQFGRLAAHGCTNADRYIYESNHLLRLCTGLGFFGNALESGAYFVQHPRFGPVCFLCTATLQEDNATTRVRSITPEDAYHRRVFLQPLALYLVATAGTISRVDVHSPPPPPGTHGLFPYHP